MLLDGIEGTQSELIAAADYYNFDCYLLWLDNNTGDYDVTRLHSIYYANKCCIHFKGNDDEGHYQF